MADVRNNPTSEANLPKTAADPGHVAVYDNDSTDGRPASALESSTADPRIYSPAPASSGNLTMWIIGLVVLALVLYFIFQALF